MFDIFKNNQKQNTDYINKLFDGMRQVNSLTANSHFMEKSYDNLLATVRNIDREAVSNSLILIQNNKQNHILASINLDFASNQI